MNEKVLQTLEYQKIIEILAAYATTDMGRSLCLSLKPLTKETLILAAQNETGDALTRIYRRGSISFEGTTDITPSLKRLSKEGTLNAGELLNIKKQLETVRNAISYGIGNEEEDVMEPDSIDAIFHSLASLDGLRKDIDRCIISPEEISDDASPSLKEIRRSIKQTNKKIHDQLTAVATSSSNKDKLQDTIVTMRNGRYCIPVKQEYRQSFPGMIHDQSSTGSTLFIEPMSVVNLNNGLKELEGKEQTEIDRILSILSGQAAMETQTLENNQKQLILLDFIFSKAKYAKDLDATMPLFREDGIIDLKQGRHPLLDPKKVVPVNISLGKDFSMLVITGPNTGGKTVSLKTVGLLTLMGQAGLHIPAFQGSSLGIYKEVFADIGDEQSIEQNLSTFSSHMTNIVSIMKQASCDSLVLLDELCGGTDPIEGAALAISILTKLHEQGIKAMATTHYSELKMFALSTSGVENASCEFNVDTLTPTYRLMIGVPGKSNAFAISKKLGLDNTIIENASGQIDQSVKDFETVLADLEKSKLTIEQEQEEIYAYRKEIESLRQSLKERKENINEKREKILRDAREKAHDILKDAKQTADHAIREYNRLSKESNANKSMEHTRSGIRKKITHLEQDMSYRPDRKKSSKSTDPKDFHIGDQVYVISLSLAGTVKTLPDKKGNLEVQMGMLSSKINIRDLEMIKSASQVKKEDARSNQRNQGHISMGKSSSMKPEINVLGMTVDEAVSAVDKFIDDAYLANLAQVTIIHGKGTGALRKGIRDHLKKQNHVAGFRDGKYGEGDMGVTVVTL